MNKEEEFMELLRELLANGLVSKDMIEKHDLTEADVNRLVNREKMYQLVDRASYEEYCNVLVLLEDLGIDWKNRDYSDLQDSCILLDGTIERHWYFSVLMTGAEYDKLCKEAEKRR